MSVRWRGRRSLVEQSDSPEFDFSGDVTTATLRFMGPYELCLSSRPQRGSEVSGYAGFTVDKSNVKRIEGGRGLLSIVATAESEDEAVGETPQNKYEVNWVQMERPLMQHPMFFYGGDWSGWGYTANPFPGRPGGAHPITPDELVAIQLWEKCPDAAIKNAGKYYTDNQKRLPAGGTALSSDGAKLYCAKRLQGIETYPVYYPVCRMTTLQTVQPEHGPCGEIWDGEQVGDLGFGSLPKTDAGLDFLYQLTADSRNRTGKSGKWERIREWTGAEYWDQDIYKVKT